MAQNTNLGTIFKIVFIIILIAPSLKIVSSEVRTSMMSAAANDIFSANKRLFGATSQHEYPLAKKIPQYMLDLHKQYNTRIRLERTKKRFKSMSSFIGNTVRGYLSKANTRKTYPNAPKSNVFRQQSFDATFSVTGIPDNELFNGAELRFFYHSQSSENDNTSITIHKLLNEVKKCEILDWLQVFHRLKSGKDALIESRVIEPNYSKWISIDVSKLIKYNATEQLIKLRVVLKTVIVRIEDPQQSRIKQCINKQSIAKNFTRKMNTIYHPFLVTYSDDMDFISKKISYNHRYKRNRNSVLYHQSKRCNLHSMYVHFVDFSWHDWIIAPNGYEAKFCQGNCPSFMSDYFNATNHAHVQSMLHSKNKKLVPPPCCVPVDYDELPLLFVDENGIVVLKGYPNMIVKACGCR